MGKQRLVSNNTCDPFGVLSSRASFRNACRPSCSGVLICLVMGLLICPSMAVADKATDDFNLGLGFYRGKRWEEAAETLGQFVKQFPAHPRTNVARLYYARSLSVLEKYPEARTEFVAYIKAEPEGKETADARYRLGECSYFLKDYPAAITQLNDYLKSHPGHSLTEWAQLLLGDSYVTVKEYDRAVEALSGIAASEANPSIRPDAMFSLGKAFEGLKRAPEAIEQYKAVAAEKNATPAPRALSRMGSLQYSMAQYKDSAATFERLLAEHSGSSVAPAANLGAGMSWYRAGEYEKAVAWLRRVPAESSSRGQATLVLAMSLKELGRIDESRQVFADALKAAGDSVFAADVLFQQAQMERTSGSTDAAAQIFEDIADRWPAFSRTSDCLFNAAELRLELNQREQAERLWGRLSTDFSEASARPRDQILLGRLQLAKGNVDEAIKVLSAATENSADQAERVIAVGRYYLVRAFYEASQHEEVVSRVAQMSELFKVESLSEVRGALALASMSSLRMKQYENVLRFAEEFLAGSKDERQRADVMAARALALSHLKRFTEVNQALAALTETYAENPQTWTAVLQSAEAALEENCPSDAESFFKIAARYEKDPAIREAGVTGIAWSQFKAAKFVEAEKSFAKIAEEYPSSEDAAQTLFMKVRCVEEQGESERTASSYQDLFLQLTANQSPAAAGAELTPPLQYAFDAGRQAARSLQKLKRIEEADRTFEKLVTQFPNAKDLDRLLDEWAWMNVAAERFERSDAIHRQILEKFPNSPFAGQARLSLAESLLDAGKLEEALREMEAIQAEVAYGAAEKERALFHVVELQAASRNWPAVITAVDRFLADYAVSPLAPQTRLFAGNAQVELQKPAEATKILTALRDEIVAGKIPVQDWTDRVWVVLAESALAAKEYEKIDTLEAELKQRSAMSPFTFQLMDVQGRRWKQQAPPDFQKARRYFEQVTADMAGQGTETAARCQFLLAETLLLEMKLDDAVKEYFKVYLNYSYDELRIQALFQAASCEVRLDKTEAAVRDFKELIANFPDSPLAKQAADELVKLGAPGE
jgi:TolA-binding protein